jgi:hypothetical protein
MVKGTQYDISDLKHVHSGGREFLCRIAPPPGGTDGSAAILKDALSRDKNNRTDGHDRFESWIEQRYERINTDITLSANSAFQVEEIEERLMRTMWADVESFIRRRLQAAKADSAFVAEFNHHIEEE